jgi:hypothetical protein
MSGKTAHFTVEKLAVKGYLTTFAESEIKESGAVVISASSGISISG